MEAKYKENINIRIPKADLGTIEKLELMAIKDGRTLNNYVCRILIKHIKRNEPK